MNYTFLFLVLVLFIDSFVAFFHVISVLYRHQKKVFSSKANKFMPAIQELDELVIGEYKFKSSRLSHSKENIPIIEHNVIDLFDIDSAWGTGMSKVR